MSSRLYIDKVGGGEIELTDFTGLKGSPGLDRSDSLIEMGMRFANGEASQGTFKVMDPEGEIPRVDYAYNLPAHKRVTWTEDASGAEIWLARGRHSTNDGGRGIPAAANHVEFDVVVDDGNVELRGQAFTEDWSRPAETGVARLIALQAYTLNGASSTAADHRDTCEVTVSTSHLAPNTNTVTMPAKVYEAGTQPQDVVTECADTEGKVYGVVIHHTGGSHLCLLYIIETDHSTYATAAKISDHLSEWDPTHATAPVLEPHWEMGKATIYDGQELVSGIVSTGSDGNVIFAEHAPNIAEYDYWVDAFSDSESENVSQQTSIASSLLAYRRVTHVTHRVSVIIEASQTHLITAGMSIQIKAVAALGGQFLNTWQTRRIAECSFRLRADGRYWVDLHLDRTPRRRPYRHGSQKVPKPPAQPVAGACTRLYFSSNDPSIDAAVDVAWEVDSRLPAGQTKTLTTTPDSTYTSSTNHTDSSAGNGSDICLWQGAISMSAGLAAVIAAGGGTIQAQLLARARSGIGISEASQNMISQIGVRVTQGATTTIRGTALNLHNLASSVGSTKWPAQTTKVNRIFPPAAAGNVLSAVSGAVAGDFLIVEVGMRNFTAVSTGGTVGSISAGGTDLPEDEVSTSLLNHWIDICTAGTAGGSTSPIVPPGQGSPGTDTGTYSPIDHEHEHYVDGEGFQHDAVDLDYDPTTSGLEAGNVQEAIDALAAGAGASTVVDHGSMGATETFDFLEGTDHEGVLSADLTATLTGATNGEAAFVTLKLTQDGTGGWDITWPGSVEWPGGVAPTFDTTAGSVSIVNLFSYDGGTIWYGFLAGGSSVGALDDLSDVTITAPSVDEVLTYDGAEWVNQASTGGASQHILLADGRPTPFTFDDLLQMDDGSDFMWSDPA